MVVRWSWRVCQLLTLGALAVAAWQVLGHTPYRVDVEVYRLGAQAWLAHRPLYGDVLFHTGNRLDLPFTYPPLAAVLFVPLTWIAFPTASVVITVITLVLTIVAMAIVLTGLDVPGRRVWPAAAIAALAVLYLEPIQSNLAYGQINVVLMTLVLADCVPRRTPWPRGLLVGLAIAVKLTPAVFLLYFALRRDGRAVLTAVVTFAVATLVGALLAWRDSLEYWTSTVYETDRIGPSGVNTNQNITGMLARLNLTPSLKVSLWALASLLVLGLTLWAVQRVLRAGEPMLALVCVALFGLVVSPVSWSHHWVWALPTVTVTAVLAYRRRNPALAAVAAIGVALMVWPTIDLLPKFHEATASWWRQLAGASYVWWALAVIAVAGATVVAAAPRPAKPPLAAQT